MDNRIYRSRETKMLGGVCGGIADMFNMDPTLVRLVAVALTFLSGFTFLLVYVLCAIIIPLEPEPGYILRRHQQPTNNGFTQPVEPTSTAPSAPAQEAKAATAPVVEQGQEPADPVNSEEKPMERAEDERNDSGEPPTESPQTETKDAPLADNDETVINTKADQY